MEHVLRGRLAHTWFVAHDTYISSCDLDSKYLSQVFSPQLVKHLLQFSLQFWFRRNSFYYSTTSKDSKIKKTVKADEKIQHAYRFQHEIPFLDQSTLFRQSLQEILNLSLRSKLNWLQIHQIATNPPHLPTQRSLLLLLLTLSINKSLHPHLPFTLSFPASFLATFLQKKLSVTLPTHKFPVHNTILLSTFSTLSYNQFFQ